MRSFRLHEPATVDEAVAALTRLGPAARPLAGGTDLVAGVMRDQIVGPAMPWPADLVDIGTIHDIDGITPDAEGITIGAGTTLVDIAESPEVRRAWPMLAQAAGEVASPEIRAIGTLGGNLHQRPRCWFFRSRDFDCIKKGGFVCYAVKGDNRYNAIVDGHVCFIVHPSDLGVALLATGGLARVASARGHRTVAMDDYFVSPTDNLLTETVLAPDELLLDVHVPRPPAATRQVWLKVNEKGLRTWDFAIASVAAIATVDHGHWISGRIVIGAVAPVPWRAAVVEAALAGRRIAEALPDAIDAFRAATRPMRDNAWKVEVAAVALEDALRSVAEEHRG
jgi:xanthine dehydrogenase YagS FAD-binding subunit